MKSIRARFDNARNARPGISTLVAFNLAVAGQRFGWDAIRRAFAKLVDEDDHEPEDKIELMRFAYDLSKKG
jgi:hypothetical protein